MSVVVTTAVVTWAISAQTAVSRSLYWVVAAAIVLAAAWLTGSATSIREAQFPKYAPVVLQCIRSIEYALREENRLLYEKSSAVQAGENRQEALLQTLKIYLRHFQQVLAQQWSNSRFGEGSAVDVVLMKRADDGNITVAAWASKRPLSLQKRSSEPGFYKNTEAAKLYEKYVDRSLRAPVHLIPDIAKEPDYDHFGREKSLRTNSTALFPIYDESGQFYGFVAVTARNRLNMFHPDDRAFWEETWSLWDPHLVRVIGEYEKSGQLLDEGR